MRRQPSRCQSGGFSYAIRGAIKQGAEVLGATGPVVIDTTSTSAIDLGLKAMKPVIVAAFASNYESVGDPATTLWSQEHRATLTVGGNESPECVWVSSSD